MNLEMYIFVFRICFFAWIAKEKLFISTEIRVMNCSLASNALERFDLLAHEADNHSFAATTSWHVRLSCCTHHHSLLTQVLHWLWLDLSLWFRCLARFFYAKNWHLWQLSSLGRSFWLLLLSRLALLRVKCFYLRLQLCKTDSVFLPTTTICPGHVPSLFRLSLLLHYLCLHFSFFLYFY